jgi:folate-dependent phosphoribosylglycinamide formyltransferase PurN
MQTRMERPKKFGDVLRRGLGPMRGEVPTPIAENPLRILFVTSAHNSLSQRCYIAVTEMGHDVSVQVVDSPKLIEAAVGAHKPDLVVCPMLKQFIAESVWRKYTCLVVHPGPHGDRGPSSLDWAIELGMEEWGVSVLEAVEEADAGDIWETRKFRMRPVGKSSIYRHEVRRAAVEMLVFAVHNFARGDFKPTALDYDDPDVTGRPLSAHQAGRPRNRLALRVDRRRCSQDPRRRGPSRRARHDRRDQLPHVQRPPRARSPWPAGRDRRDAQRRDLPSDRRRRRVDHAPEGERRGWEPAALLGARRPSPLKGPTGSRSRTSRCAPRGCPGPALARRRRSRVARPDAHGRARTGAAAGRSPGTRSLATG